MTNMKKRILLYLEPSTSIVTRLFNVLAIWKLKM